MSKQLSVHSNVCPFNSVPDAHGERVARLFREHNASLLRFLRARLRSDDEAREIAQEAYVQLLGLDQPEAVRFLQGYLFRTAANLATNRLKQRAFRQRSADLVFFELEHQDTRSPERAWEAKWSVASVYQALNELPANCREAFRLVRLEGLSSEEAGRRLNLHPRRVRRYVARALTHCLAVLEPAAQESPP